MHVDFPASRPYTVLIDAVNEGESLKLLGSYLVGENQNGWATV